MEQLIEFIRSLSIHDKKSLAQKTLKVSEEQGELAKAVLPFLNAYSTTHRFVPDIDILEEAVDTILAAISIPFSMGFTNEQIIQMIHDKSQYWAQLQAGEDKLNYPLPFEIHVTVTKPEDIDEYKKVCSEINVKPIVLDLENYKGAMIDVMTSSVHYGDNRSAFIETQRIASLLAEKGYNVIRKKIETFPFHPAAPSEKGAHQKMPEGCYFECHISVIVFSPSINEFLNEIVKDRGAHLSRNFFKKIDEGKFIKMVTLRSYDGTYETFKSRVEALKKHLTTYDFTFEKEIVEFSIYDTKVSHDFKWLNQEIESK